MLSKQDFSKKQIVVVFFNEGEKLAFSNDNLLIKSADGSIKMQCTCYRVFLVFAIGHSSITSAVIQKARKFGFFIALLTPGFHLYSIIGAEKDGNTLLHKKQYMYTKLDIAQRIIQNKIQNQIQELKNIRQKSISQKESILSMQKYLDSISTIENLSELMAYEGLAAKVYFSNFFTNVRWLGRKPRIKQDFVNSALDIGYTILFTFIDVLLSCYGFDTYCGVMHRQFYMRKSLVCDLVEPFRTIIDHALKRAIGLKQISDKDFLEMNHQKRLKWEESGKVVKLFMQSILDQKEAIFIYIQEYYRAFMKGVEGKDFPVFIVK